MKAPIVYDGVVIKGKKLNVPIIQGGMGVGVSLAPLASAVAREGGLGIISSACLDLVTQKRRRISGKESPKIDIKEAIIEEIRMAKHNANEGLVGINIMWALQKDYKKSVEAAIKAGADAIICGAGLPTDLPDILNPRDTALIPIVSSARALNIILKRWEKFGYRPDAVVVEGPLAGGHLGFKFDDIEKEEMKLENIFPPIKEMAMAHGDFPVFVAGGIYDSNDILRWKAMGADGVQMGTRFLATEESSANLAYKLAVVECKEEDILVVDSEKMPPGSSCGLPFRIIEQSPMFTRSKERKPKCNKGYVLQKDKEGNFTICPAKTDNEKVFCICNGLCSSADLIGGENELPLWTVGTNAYRVDKILPVKELMKELTSSTE